MQFPMNPHRHWDFFTNGSKREPVDIIDLKNVLDKMIALGVIICSQ